MADYHCDRFQDALVIKLGPNGVLLAATFLGGDKYDEGNAIALDSSGNVYVVGQTEGGSFPVTVGAYRTTPPNSMYNVFVAKLNNTLSSLLYSTYLGGTGEAEQWGTAIAVNQSGEVYVTGPTDATDFPIKNAFQATTGGSRDAFVAMINPNNTGEDSLVYSSYLGG